MAVYEKIVRLPSMGLLNPDNPELAGDIKLSMIETGDEKSIFGSPGDQSIDDMIARRTSPSINAKDLCHQDRHFLMVQLRILSYGDIYYSETPCEACGRVALFKNSLSEVPYVFIREDYSEPFSIGVLPIAGKELGVRILKRSDFYQINNLAKQFVARFGGKVAEEEYILRISRSIVSIDGVSVSSSDAETFVKSLKGMDSAYIYAKSVALNKFGYPDLMDSVCPLCGSSVEILFSLSSEFFRPRFD